MRGTYRLRQAHKALRHQIDRFEARWGYLYLASWQNNRLPQALGFSPRLALVKQDVFQDLYCCPPGSSAQQIIFSSLKRTGPVALFTRFNTDFWIVKTEPDPECNVWQEKWFDCRQNPIEHYLTLKTEPFLDGSRGHTVPQGEYSVSVDEIDWGQYDIVISLDIAIPARLTMQYRRAVWCYFISEPCMRSYRQSQRAPIQGYDLFLNQRYRHLRLMPGLARHEVEFPYFSQYHGCFHDLCETPLASAEREGIFLESHTARELTGEQFRQLETFGPVRLTRGGTEEIVRGLMESKYFLRLGGRVLWGNAMVEAIAAGCLALGNPREYKHTSLFTPATCVRHFDEAMDRLAQFESDTLLYQRESRRQRNLLNYTCSTRPINDLFSKTRLILNCR